MILCSLLYTVARFSGLEYHASYFGNAFQALHPQSFHGDPLMPPFRPTMLSLYYVVARWVGDLWLDDRFLIVVYGGLVLLAVLALDKTVRLFGADRVGRLAIISLMLVPHSFKTNLAQLVSSVEFNPTTVAEPAALWVLYLALAGAPIVLQGAVMALLLLVSIKSAWMPILLGLAILFKERLTIPAQRRLGWGVLALIGLAVGLYYTGGPEAQARVGLFNYNLHVIEQAEANPFWDPWWSNGLFLVLCGCAWRVRLASAELERRVKLVAIVGLSMWLLGGLYLSLAERVDLLKIHYLVPLAFNRALWWPQYVLYVAIGVSALRWLKRTPSWRGVVGSTAVLLALYLTPFHLKRAVIAGVVLGVFWGWRYLAVWRSLRILPPAAAMAPSWRVGIIAVVLGATQLSALASAAIHRAPALEFLAQHGIIGDGPGAKWVGINEYFRDRTPSSATVLALTMGDVPWRPRGLMFEGSLRTRTGRSMPFVHPQAFIFDYPSLSWYLRDRAPHHDLLLAAWERHDAAGVMASLSAIGTPNYLVIPKAKAEWLHGHPNVPYRVETVIGDFTILRASAPRA